MEFFRGVDKLGPTSTELSNGWTNWPIHMAPPATGRFRWFKSQINPQYATWDQNTSYKINERVRWRDANYFATQMVTKGTGSQPPDTSSRWKKHLFVPKDVTALGQNWRAETPGGLIATSGTEVGAFDHKEYVYRMEYADNDLRGFALNPDGSVNGVAATLAAANMAAYLLISDATTAELLVAETFTVLGLYHGVVSTKEITFLTPVPRDKFIGWRKGGSDNKGNFKTDFTTTTYP